MSESPQDQVTAILLESAGPGASAARLERLLPLVYEELRIMAGRHLRRDGSDVTLSPTELVHEAYLRLADGTRVTDRGRAYFFAAAARAMRHIIADHVRSRLDAVTPPSGRPVQRQYHPDHGDGGGLRPGCTDGLDLVEP